MRLLAIAFALSTAAATPAPAPSAAALSGPLGPMGFLLGAWEGVGGGKDAAGSGQFSFRVVNQGHAVLRTNSASYPATADRAAYRHEDVMIVYAEGSEARADYCDSEDHVIHYRLEAVGGEGVRFVSEAAARGPRYRLTYRPTGPGTVEGTFEVAAPGTDAFQRYLSWTARRTGE